MARAEMMPCGVEMACNGFMNVRRGDKQDNKCRRWLGDSGPLPNVAVCKTASARERVLFRFKLPLNQKFSLKPNWICRGKLPWFAATNPKLMSVGVVLGFPRIGVLKILNASARN